MTDNKETDNVDQHVDHQRWLLEHGFVNDLHKDNLFMYGSIVHIDVMAVQVDIDVESKKILYDLYVKSSLLDKIAKYKELSQSTSITGLWRFKRMLKKEGNLNLKHLLMQFVNDYCGPKWLVEVKLRDYKDYEEGFKEKEKTRDDKVDKQPDGG